MKFRSVGPQATVGSLTLPAEEGHEATVRELFAKWGADAIRDSDGTTLSPELVAMGHPIYSTICLVRADQECARRHPDMMPMKFLSSEPVTAAGDSVVIAPLEGFHREKYRLATSEEALSYWEVMDRTTGALVERSAWKLDADKGTVTVTGTEAWHAYTASVLVDVIWDTTSMYNHLVNKWDRPHVMSVDPYHKAAWDELMAFYDRWLAARPKTSVVRLTTLAYHFNLDVNPDGSDKFRDWVGYQETVSLPALRDFENEYGYRLRAEDFVDEGYYNATARVPSKRYLDWMAFVHKFVVRFGKELVERDHAAGKKTAMFWGDHWVGTEPYSEHFQEVGIDIHVGACEGGVALRRVADAPGKMQKEVRLYPYFFPDVFRRGGDPLGESVANWVKIRRALMRKPIDRIGYGGYLSLVKQFPEFVEHVAAVANEFREWKEMAGRERAWTSGVRVAVLNAWGKRRSWINSFGAPQKFLEKRPDVTIVAGTDLLECLAGLPVEVEFVSFDDVRAGVLERFDVVINDGDAETAWSGGRHWVDPEITAALRAFVHRGGGFVGCRGATAFAHGGRYFQLSDVLGVESETGPGVQTCAPPARTAAHFITADAPKAGALGADTAEAVFGQRESFVYVSGREATVLAARDRHVLAAANTFGRGRGVYFAGLPYNLDNARMLLRALLWAAGREAILNRWHAANPLMGCAWYPSRGVFVVTNNDASEQSTVLYDGEGEAMEVSLPGYGRRWYAREKS